MVMMMIWKKYIFVCSNCLSNAPMIILSNIEYQSIEPINDRFLKFDLIFGRLVDTHRLKDRFSFTRITITPDNLFEPFTAN